jgi:hypothetical protein
LWKQSIKNGKIFEKKTTPQTFNKPFHFFPSTWTEKIVRNSFLYLKHKFMYIPRDYLSPPAFCRWCGSGRGSECWARALHARRRSEYLHKLSSKNIGRLFLFHPRISRRLYSTVNIGLKLITGTLKTYF